MYERHVLQHYHDKDWVDKPTEAAVAEGAAGLLSGCITVKIITYGAMERSAYCCGH
ncbi:hypothetical protein O5699_00480 [Escherichia coli]|nr:hypothetical protein [Escherichia coli]